MYAFNSIHCSKFFIDYSPRIKQLLKEYNSWIKYLSSLLHPIY